MLDNIPNNYRNAYTGTCESSCHKYMYIQNIYHTSNKLMYSKSFTLSKLKPDTGTAYIIYMHYMLITAGTAIRWGPDRFWCPQIVSQLSLLLLDKCIHQYGHQAHSRRCLGSPVDRFRSVRNPHSLPKKVLQRAKMLSTLRLMPHSNVYIYSTIRYQETFCRQQRQSGPH